MEIKVCVMDGYWVATLVGTTLSAKNTSRDEALTILRDMVVRSLAAAVEKARYGEL